MPNVLIDFPEEGTITATRVVVVKDTTKPDQGGNLSVEGKVTAGDFAATVIPDTALSANVPLLNANQNFLQVTDLGTESLQDGALAATTKWAGAGDMSDTIAGTASYTDSAHSGSLTQSNGDLTKAGCNSRWYRFTYTLSAVTAGSLVGTITNAFASAAVSLTMTAGTHSVDFLSNAAAATADFVLAFTSAASGAFTLDNLTLKEIIGPDVFIGGSLTAKTISVPLAANDAGAEALGIAIGGLYAVTDTGVVMRRAT